MSAQIPPEPDREYQLLGDWIVYADALRERIAELERALAEAKRDAERYRWLRSKAKRNAVVSKNKHAGDIHVIQWADKTEANVLRMEELDSAIDAAKGEV
jgi:hypothetical protein